MLDYLDSYIADGKKSAAVIFIDIDRFKYVNDTFGHTTGDDLLVEIAHRLRQVIRSEDIVGRLGGDEFIVILTDIKNDPVAWDTANSIIEVLSPSISLVDFEFTVTASLGIALYPRHADNRGDLLQYADTAMYLAKSKGRNRIGFYSSELTAEAKYKIILESELRAALDNQEFEIYYQPRIHLKTNCISSVEALIRWNHPQRGLIAPDMFLPVANETAVIVEIGKWVLEESCRAAARWSRLGADTIGVSVNVAELQVRSGTLPAIVETALADAALAPAKLEIEVLEECVMINDLVAARTFKALSDLGVRMSIDDFGASYSSLSRLTHLPFETLKMDGVFLKDFPQHDDERAIVQTILTLGHNLGMRVVAECIETEEQAKYLRNFGCDEGQGYFFARPLPESELLKFIDSRISEEA